MGKQGIKYCGEKIQILSDSASIFAGLAVNMSYNSPELNDSIRNHPWKRRRIVSMFDDDESDNEQQISRAKQTSNEKNPGIVCITIEDSDDDNDKQVTHGKSAEKEKHVHTDCITIEDSDDDDEQINLMTEKAGIKVTKRGCNSARNLPVFKELQNEPRSSAYKNGRPDADYSTYRGNVDKASLIIKRPCTETDSSRGHVQNQRREGTSSRHQEEKCNHQDITSVSASNNSDQLHAVRTVPGSRAKSRKKEPKEKRKAKYRPIPSQAVLDRMERSRIHRLFLVNKKIEGNAIKCAVMGANGNIYNCSIDTKPTCNCQDFLKRSNGPCKHLIFLFIRVLKVEEEDPRWWQKCLLQSELEGLLENAQVEASRNAQLFAEEAVISQYQRTQAQKNKQVVRRPLVGECTVCYDNLIAVTGKRRPENLIDYCRTCGNNFHAACLTNWFRAQNQKICPTCRVEMRKSEEITGKQDYLNLSQFSTTHERQLSLSEMYADTHRYIGRGSNSGTKARRGR